MEVLIAIGVIIGIIAGIVEIARELPRLNRIFRSWWSLAPKRNALPTGHSTSSTPNRSGATESVIQQSIEVKASETREGEDSKQYPKTIHEIVARGPVQEGESCPKCRSGHFIWSGWGRGPYFHTNAWYRCSNDECRYQLPSLETPED